MRDSAAGSTIPEAQQAKQQAEAQQATQQAEQQADSVSKITSYFRPIVKRKAEELTCAKMGMLELETMAMGCDMQELKEARAQKKVVRLQIQQAEAELSQLKKSIGMYVELNEGERIVVNAMRRHNVKTIGWDRADQAASQKFQGITARTQKAIATMQDSQMRAELRACQRAEGKLAALNYVGEKRISHWRESHLQLTKKRQNERSRKEQKRANTAEQRRKMGRLYYASTTKSQVLELCEKLKAARGTMSEAEVVKMFHGFVTKRLKETRRKWSAIALEGFNNLVVHERVSQQHVGGVLQQCFRLFTGVELEFSPPSRTLVRQAIQSFGCLNDNRTSTEIKLQPVQILYDETTRRNHGSIFATATSHFCWSRHKPVLVVRKVGKIEGKKGAAIARRAYDDCHQPADVTSLEGDNTNSVSGLKDGQITHLWRILEQQAGRETRLHQTNCVTHIVGVIHEAGHKAGCGPAPPFRKCLPKKNHTDTFLLQRFYMVDGGSGGGWHTVKAVRGEFRKIQLKSGKWVSPPDKKPTCPKLNRWLWFENAAAEAIKFDEHGQPHPDWVDLMYMLYSTTEIKCNCGFNRKKICEGPWL